MNFWQVIYTNEKPRYQEFGPYIYRESDTYSDLNYTKLDNQIGQEELDVVYNTFTQGNTFTEDGDGFIDEPMYLPNQAAFGVWYQQNAAKDPTQQWRVYLTLIYSAIQDGLGNQVIQNGAWIQMRGSKFNDPKKINTIFVHNNKVTAEQEDALYNDPWYGLGDVTATTYAHWNNLMYTDDPAAKMMQVAWMWELRTYFGLTFAQVQEMQENWNLFYNDEV